MAGSGSCRQAGRSSMRPRPGGWRSARWGSETGKEARHAGGQQSEERREQSGVRERSERTEITREREAATRMNRAWTNSMAGVGLPPRHVSPQRLLFALRRLLPRCIEVRVCGSPGAIENGMDAGAMMIWVLFRSLLVNPVNAKKNITSNVGTHTWSTK